MSILKKILITKYNWSLYIPGIIAGIILNIYSVPLYKIVDSAFFVVVFLILMVPLTNILVSEILNMRPIEKFLNILVILLNIYPLWTLKYLGWAANSEILIVFIVPLIIFSFLLLIKNILIISTSTKSSLSDQIFLGLFIGLCSFVLVIPFVRHTWGIIDLNQITK